MAEKETFTIWIVCPTPEDMLVAQCFAEIAEGLQEAFHTLGYPSFITYNPREVQGTAIVLAARLLHLVKKDIPSKIIIYNLEQLHSNMSFNSSVDAYMEMLRKYPVWDYSESNAQYLAAMGCPPEAILPLGYSPCLSRIKKGELQDVDVLFYGTPHPRRTRIIQQLKEKGINAVFLHKVYGQERDQWIARSKIVLNIHMQPANVFEIARVSFLMANHKCIVSESGNDHALETPYRRAISFCSYENIVDRCIELLNDGTLVTSYEKLAFNTFIEFSQHELLAHTLKGRLQSEHRNLNTINTIIDNSHSIFIALPSYLDKECVSTILRIFESALHPENITVGVCWQTHKEFGSFPWDKLDKWKHQVHVREYDLTEAKGANWARHQAGLFYENQAYYLLMDAHMYMVEGWDSYLIEQYVLTEEDEVVLTYYCPPFKPPKELTSPADRNRRLAVDRFGGDKDPQLIHLTRHHIDKSDPRFGIRYPSPFVIHHFIFTKGEVFKRFPIDPHIHFWGDEITLSARLWTHGINIYQLPRLPAFHQWFGRQEASANYRDLKNASNQSSNQRVRSILGLEDNAHQFVEVEYSLGTIRDMNSFWKFAGVDLLNRRITDEAKKGFWNLAVKDADIGKSKLAAAVNADKLKSKQPSPTDSMSTMSSSPSLLICISSKQIEPLERLLFSLFHSIPDNTLVDVAIAWYDSKPFSLPKSLHDHKDRIRHRHVVVPLHGNAWNDAIAMWKQQDYIAVVNDSVVFEPDWYASVQNALADLPEAGYLTQAALNETDSHQSVSANIALKPIMLQSQLAIVPIALGVKRNKSKLVQPTQVISFDFAMAPASRWMSLLPDPHLPAELSSIVYSARCFTHGIEIKQLTKPIIQQQVNVAGSGYSAVHSRINPMIRAKHILAITYAEDETSLLDLDNYGHGDAGDMDAFWRLAGVDFALGSIQNAALEGKWDKISSTGNDEKNSVLFSNVLSKTKMIGGALPKIFVQIASYRDEQCQYTVQDLFAKAEYPDRITVGICWQTIPEEDEECFRIVTRPEQVRVVHFNASESKGACWARYHTQKLWQGEEYTLQIDSHMRFEKHWDTLLMDMFTSIGEQKAVLTTYPAGFTPPNDLKPKAAHKLIAKEFNSQGIFLMGSKQIDRKNQKEPVLGAYISACFLFGPSSIIKDVPYDPYLYFFGEEISLSVRLWTHGYNIYHPHKHLVWHDWKRENRKTTHFKDHKTSDELNRKSFARVRYLLNREVPKAAAMKEYVVQELDAYGLGHVRTIEAYEQYSGVNFRERRIEAHAVEGVFESRLTTTLEDVEVEPDDRHAQNVAPPVSFGQEPFIAPKKPLIISKSKRLELPSEQLVRNHGAVKTYESKEVIVYDDFLPEDLYESLYNYATRSDYKHINTTGNVARVWTIDNGFPLRTSWNAYYEALGQQKHAKEETYPMQKPTDRFIEYINTMAPNVAHVVGAPAVDWAHYSVSGWIYPPNTGLSLHNDGSGAYTGAYVYFLNKEWRIHWGGLLMVLDGVANEAIETHKKHHNPHQFHRDKWLHESEHNDYALEAGFARTIFPKRNRMVYIAPDAYHIVTKVLPNAGDNVRMTFAGFFNRGILNKNANEQKTKK